MSERIAVPETPGSGPLVSSDEAQPPGLACGWETAYRENVGWVYRFVFGRLGNRADAEDVTADVFTRALPRMRLAAQPEQVRAYLAATTRSVLADYWRRSYGLDLPMPADFDLAEPSPVGAPRADNLNRANRLLALLSDHYRRVLELRFLEGRSIAETARVLGVSVGSVKVLQYRALRRAAQLGHEELQ